MWQKYVAWFIILIIIAGAIYLRDRYRKSELMNVYLDEGHNHKVGDIIERGVKNEKIIVVKSYPKRIVVKRYIK